MKKGKILYLEDNPEWVEHINELLAEYDVHTADTFLDASASFSPDEKYDLAIIDIDIKIKDTFIARENRYYEDEIHPKGGFMFIRQLLESKGGYLREGNIIILSGRVQNDNNWQVLTEEFHVAGVFDKGDFLDKMDELKSLVDSIVTINRTKDVK